MYISDRNYYVQPIAPTTTPLRCRNYFRVYQSRHTEKAVMISLTVEDKSDIEEKLDPERVYIDLDNFGKYTRILLGLLFNTLGISDSSKMFSSNTN